MSTANLVRLAKVISGLILCFLVGALVFCLLTTNVVVSMPGLDWYERAVAALGLAAVPIIGALIVTRQPHNLYGWVWLAFGFSWSFYFLLQGYAVYAIYVAPAPWVPIGLIAGLAAYGWATGIAMIPFLLLLFPNGRLPSPRWRYLAWLILILLALVYLVGWAMPGQSGIVPVENPYGITGPAGQAITALVFAFILILVGTILLAALSVFLRFRTAQGAERQQLKWFVVAAGLLVVYLISDFVVELPGIWESIKEAIAFNFLTVALGIAILRYRLFDIDLIIRRTLTYALVAALLAIVYFGSVVVLQQVFASVTGQHSEVVTVISTLAIAALFVPLRIRMQGIVDRRFYRKKYDAQQVLADFARTVRDETDLTKLTGKLIEVVQETMQPTRINVALNEDANPSTMARP